MKKALIVFVKNTISETREIVIPPPLINYPPVAKNQIGCSKFVFYSNTVPTKDDWQQNGFQPGLQRGGDVGECMLNALLHVFSKRFDKVILSVGKNHPLSQNYIEQTFNALDENDVIVVPSENGGYSLLAMKRLYPYLFFNKSWHTGKVLAETLEEIEQHQLSVSLLGSREEIIKNIQSKEATF